MVIQFQWLKFCSIGNMNMTLEQIKTFAEQAHGNQQRKFRDEKYINHLIRVKDKCGNVISSAPVLAAALLHDVLEDTAVSKKELHDFLNTVMKPADATATLQLVTELTDVYTKFNYPQWNRRKRKSKEVLRLAETSANAQTIKYADIIDNCHDIVTGDPDFAAVFIRECHTLLSKMQRGNQDLRQQAMRLVDDGLKQLAGTEKRH